MTQNGPLLKQPSPFDEIEKLNYDEIFLRAYTNVLHVPQNGASKRKRVV